MKRILIYIALLTALCWLPSRGMDVGKLKPVGLVQLYKEGETVFIVTDTGESGLGDTVAAAFDNLEQTTAGVIFLDTADYLLVSRNAAQEAGELAGYLKPSTRICVAAKGTDPVQAAEYLSVHCPTVKVKDYEGLQNVQILVQENGRLRLK